MSTSELPPVIDDIDKTDETVEHSEKPDETFIVHRYTDDKGNTVEKRMPTSEWPAYARENDL